MTVDKGISEAAAAGVPASAIEFRLDPASGVPTYLQLVHQVEHALRLGYLKLGDQLPKVRDVVASLAINPNTVSKAYRELETKGLIVGRPGQGTFILATLRSDQLPKVRDVVASLAINPNTVSKAYRELETKGLIVGRPGQGTFILATL